MKWIKFDREKGNHQKLPKEHRLVLCHFLPRKENGMDLPAGICVGYFKFAAGDKMSPYFVTIGIGGGIKTIAYWSDCLEDNFKAPLWKATFNVKEKK